MDSLRHILSASRYLTVLWLSIASACFRASDAQPVEYGFREGLPLRVEWVDSLVVDERPPVVLVEPDVYPDPRGGFLVSDRREARIHRFGFDGSLKWTAGGRGGGPGEFSGAAAVGRLPSGGIIALDRNGELTLFDSLAHEVLLTQRTGLARIDDMEVLDSSRILLAGAPAGNPMLERIHIYDFQASTVLRSFFRAFDGVTNLDAAAVAGWVKLSLHSDTIAAIFSVKDTLFLFDLFGNPIRRIPLATTNYRRVYAQEASGPRRVDPSTAARWLSTFDLVAEVQWLSGDKILTPYQSIGSTEALERTWHLLVADSDGSRIWELRDAPRPLIVDMKTGTVTFVSPGSITPNRWSLGRLHLKE